MMQILAFVASALALAAAGDSISLAGITLGESALDVVRVLGPPDRVSTGDAGHEWRWYDAKGLDREVLTDDTLAASEISVARPLPAGDRATPLVQPSDIPILEAPISQAIDFLAERGAVPLAQPNSAIRAWRWKGAIFAADIKLDRLVRLRALDAASAARLGYLKPHAPPYAYRAPRFAHVASAGFPKRAADAGAHGIVVARVEVDVNGKPARVSVILSSGNRDLDDAEIESMRRSTFVPAYCDDRPCPGVLLDREEFIP